MHGKFLSVTAAALTAIPNYLAIVPRSALVIAIALTPVAAPRVVAAPSFGNLQDTLPCNPYLSQYKNSCLLLHERINLFQGLRGSKPALQYCREKYGSNASVVWRLGLRWCATPHEA